MPLIIINKKKEKSLYFFDATLSLGHSLSLSPPQFSLIFHCLRCNSLSPSLLSLSLSRCFSLVNAHTLCLFSCHLYSLSISLFFFVALPLRFASASRRLSFSFTLCCNPDFSSPFLSAIFYLLSPMFSVAHSPLSVFLVEIVSFTHMTHKVLARKSRRILHRS